MSGKRRILEVFGEPIISGGQEAFAINVVKNFNEEGTVIDFYTPYYCGNGYYRSIVENKGGKVFEEGLPFTPGKGRENIFQPLVRHLKKNLYNVVHVHSGSLSVLALVSKAAHQCGVPKIVVHSHSPAEHESLHHLAAKMRYAGALKKYPTDYLACSKSAAAWKYPRKIAENKTIIIKNGIDLELYRPNDAIREEVRKKLGIAETTKVIGQVGRFSHEKNHEFSVKLLKQLLDRGNDVKLLLLGDGELRNDIERLVAESHLESFVLFTGNVTDVSGYMQAMDVMILPSLYEGLPLTGVEAQAAGLPLVVSSGVSEEINISGDVKRISLDSIEEWIRTIENAAVKRKDYSEILRGKGYDIMQTVYEIRKVYQRNQD